jgi:tryptophan halogenase
MKKINSVKRITIVGGGTSAWLSAAFFLKQSQFGTEIVVIDKEKGNPVGVGEATLLSFKTFMDFCGFPIQSWFDEIDATFKSGILFTNWNRQNDDIWHPFCFPQFDFLKSSLLNLWSKTNFDLKTHGSALYECSVKENKIDTNNIGAYAFHIDCGKLVKFIQSQIKNNINFINSEVIDIIRDDTGDINHLLLVNGQKIESDLYIDCTGFKRFLGSKPKTVNLRDRLFCDTAIAGHIPYKNESEEMRPYVICDAVEHGWIWNIPVRSRIGSGLVFNRSVTDIEEAKEYFVNYWDNRVEKESLKVIDWTPYYHENFWDNNVVSIGLSAGFIEPLESTGVGLICAGILELGDRLKKAHYNYDDINLYNCKMKCFFESAVDFVNMHYSNTNRFGKFWEWVKREHKVNTTHQYFIDEFLNNPYSFPYGGTEMFDGNNWSIWLCQLNTSFIPKFADGVDTKHSYELVNNFYDNEIEKHKNSILHSEFVKTFTKELNGKNGKNIR